MIRRAPEVSFVTFATGVGVQGYGLIIVERWSMTPEDRLHGGCIFCVGLLIMMTALTIYAIGKGRSPFWGCVGLLGCWGYALLAGLEDRSGVSSEPTPDRKRIQTEDLPE